MKCLTKPTVFLVVAAYLVLTIIGSNSVQQVDARVFRHGAVKEPNSIRMQKAEHIALREHYYTIRYHGTNLDDEPMKDTEMPAALNPARAPSILEATVRQVASTILGFFSPQDGEAPIQSKKLEEIANTLTNEAKSPQEPKATPKSPSRRDGKLCIAGMCGLNLAFASLWVTFAACFVVVCLMDRHMHSKSISHNKKETKETEQNSKPAQKAAVETKRSSVTTSRKKDLMTTTKTGIRAQIFNYYHDVAEMSSSMLRQRPPLGI